MSKWIRALGDCTKGGFLSMGLSQCEIKSMGSLIGIILVRKGFKFKEADLTQAGWSELLKKGTMHPIEDVFGYEANNTDDTIATSSLGINVTVMKGKPGFNLQYTKGYCNHKKLWDKQNGVWDVILVFEKGLVGAESFNGENFVGLDLSWYNVQNYAVQTGDTPEQSTVQIQLGDVEQFNTRLALLTWDKLGFNTKEVNAPVETILDVDAKAGTEITVKVTSYCNTSVAISQLEELTNWTVNNVAPTAVSYDVAIESYKIEVPIMTAGNSISIILDGEDAEGNIFKGNYKGVVKA